MPAKLTIPDRTGTLGNEDHVFELEFASESVTVGELETLDRICGRSAIELGWGRSPYGQVRRTNRLAAVPAGTSGGRDRVGSRGWWLLPTFVGLLAGCAPGPGSSGGGQRTGGGLTLNALDGGVTATFGANLRPSRITGDGLIADFAWTGSGQVEITVRDGAVTARETMGIDDSEAGLRAAVEAYGNDTGQDVSQWAAWLAEHSPEGGSRLVAGAPEKQDSDSRAALVVPTGVVFQQSPRQRIEAHVDGLSRAAGIVANLRNIIEGFVNNPPAGISSEVYQAWVHLLEVLNTTVNLLHEDFKDQEAACWDACTLRCRVPCVATDMGACCTASWQDDVRIYDCEETTPERCVGDFSPGYGCNEIGCPPGGACCVNGGDCHDTTGHEECEQYSNEVGGAWFVYAEGDSCESIQSAGDCMEGVCCLPGGICADSPALRHEADCESFDPPGSFVRGALCDEDPCGG